MYARLRRLHADRYEIALPAGMGRLFRDQRQVADVMLNIAYQGDIGWLFCGDVLIADNFCNGETWQVGLRDYADAIDAAGGKLTLVVTPLEARGPREGNIVDGGPPGAVRCVRR